MKKDIDTIAQIKSLQKAGFINDQKKLTEIGTFLKFYRKPPANTIIKKK